MSDRSDGAVAYLPASLLRAVAAHPARGLPWVDEVDGTMVMADLSGFTAMSERLSMLGDEGAERLTDIINSFFERMLKTASAFGGDTLTFGGDAILLLFEGSDHAGRAAAASLAMLKQVERAAAVDVGGGKIKVGMSVGAHSDTFLLSAAGLEEERASLFVLGRGGETTALAEAQADRGQLAVSWSTKDLLPPGSRLEPAAEYRIVAGLPPLPSPPLAADGEPLPDDRVEALIPFLPPYVRTSVREGGRRVQHHPEHRRTVIAFVDVLGITDVIGREGVEGGLAQVQSYFALLTRLAAKYHGFIVSTDIATQGSKVIVTFGTPVAHEHAPANAARFALELSAGLRDSGLDLQHKIGLNGGHIFAGEVGPPYRRQYTVMGDDVNLAARLMAAAPLGEALISRKLLEYIGPDLCARELEPIKVKGKEALVEICLLGDETGTGREVHGRAGEGRRQGALFGRQAELADILQKWEEARQGTGRAVLVEGEAGVGKTRLVEEALCQLPEDTMITRVACFEHLQAAPLTPWVDALESIMDVARDAPVRRRSARARAYIAAHLPDLKDFGPLLNPLLNIALPQNPIVDALDVQSRRQRLFELITGLLTEAADDGAHVIVLEDLHWMDDSSMALAGYFVRQMAQTPILVVMTMRPMAVPESLEKAGMELISLTELTRLESLTMVREALGVQEFPEEVGEAVYAKTKGNPLFLEEVIHSLRARDVLERILAASSVTRAAELAALEIPDRVQGLLMSRIDALPADTRNVLKAGSVVGRSFDRSTLQGIEGDAVTAASLDRAFGELIDAALVVSAAGNDEGTSVTFRHALVQDVAYESLPFSRRRELHGRIARYLEATQPSPDHPLLVHHYKNAGDDEKTRFHAVRSAQGSAATAASLEAVDYLEVALATVHGSTPRAACLRSRIEELMGESLEVVRPPEAPAAYIRARRRWASARVRQVSEVTLRDLAPVEDQEGQESLLCWKTALALGRGLSEYKRSLRWLDKANSALPHGRKALATRILYGKAAILYRLGRFREALEIGREAVDLSRAVEDPVIKAYALAELANAYHSLGLLQEGDSCLVEAATLFEQGRDIAGQALAHSNLGYSRYLLGDFHSALEHSELALSLYARVGLVSGVASMHMNIAGLLAQFGERDAAIEHYREVTRLQERHSISAHVAGYSRLFLSEVLSDAGDADGAERVLAEAAEILRGLDSAECELEIGLVDARLGLRCGDYQRAERQCKSAIEQAQSMGAEVKQAEALCVMGRLRLRQGDAVAAAVSFEEGAALAGRIDLDYERAQAVAGLAEAKAACAEGDPACEDLLGEAIRTFERMGAARDLREALELRHRLAAGVWDPTP